jgi:hypothetical protein
MSKILAISRNLLMQRRIYFVDHSITTTLLEDVDVES